MVSLIDQYQQAETVKVIFTGLMKYIWTLGVERVRSLKSQTEQSISEKLCETFRLFHSTLTRKLKSLKGECHTWVKYLRKSNSQSFLAGFTLVRFGLINMNSLGAVYFNKREHCIQPRVHNKQLIRDVLTRWLFQYKFCYLSLKFNTIQYCTNVCLAANTQNKKGCTHNCCQQCCVQLIGLTYLFV